MLSGWLSHPMTARVVQPIILYRQRKEAPMQLPGKIVDISMALDDVIVVDPPAMRPKISMMEHGDNLDRWRKLYPGLDTDDLPGGVASA